MRGKKGLTAFRRPVIEMAATDELRLDPMVDNVSRLLQNYGFHQVVLPPSHDGKPGAAGELTLPQSYLQPAASLYREFSKDRPPAVAKWFYLQPVAAVWDENAVINHELGVFLFGDDGPLAYAQLVSVLNHLFSGLGASGFAAHITSRGCGNCQKEYRDALTQHFQRAGSSLCEECSANLERNFAAVFSCRLESCHAAWAEAPQILDFLDEPCRECLVETLETIDELEIPYTLNPSLPGNAAAEKIAFDFSVSPQAKLGWGGNLTRLSAAAASQPAPVVGFLSMLENLFALIPADRRGQPVMRREVFVVSLGSAASRRALALYRDLYTAGIAVGEAMLGNQGLRNQLKEALEHRAEIALIIGQKEAQDETVILRDIRSGMQEVFTSERIIEEVRKRLGK